jgi:hypothetical protein
LSGTEAQPERAYVMSRFVSSESLIGETEAGTTGRIADMAEHEIRLEREGPVVENDVVAKGRVRLEKDLTTERRKVQEEVREERVDVERRDDASGS